MNIEVHRRFEFCRNAVRSFSGPTKGSMQKMHTYLKVKCVQIRYILNNNMEIIILKRFTAFNEGLDFCVHIVPVHCLNFAVFLYLHRWSTLF